MVCLFLYRGMNEAMYMEKNQCIHGLGDKDKTHWKCPYLWYLCLFGHVHEPGPFGCILHENMGLLIDQIKPKCHGPLFFVFYLI